MTNEVTLKTEQTIEAVKLVQQGWSLVDVALRYGMQVRDMATLLKQQPAMAREVNENVRMRALTMREELLDELLKIAKHGKNESSRVRAIESINRHAGIQFEKSEAGTIINIFDQSVTMNDYSGPEYDKLVQEMADKLGVKKFVDAEFIRGPAGEDSDGDGGGTEEGPPGASETAG